MVVFAYVTMTANQEMQQRQRLQQQEQQEQQQRQQMILSQQSMSLSQSQKILDILSGTIVTTTRTTRSAAAQIQSRSHAVDGHELQQLQQLQQLQSAVAQLVKTQQEHEQLLQKLITTTATPYTWTTPIAGRRIKFPLVISILNAYRAEVYVRTMIQRMMPSLNSTNTRVVLQQSMNVKDKRGDRAFFHSFGIDVIEAHDYPQLAPGAKIPTSLVNMTLCVLIIYFLSPISACNLFS